MIASLSKFERYEFGADSVHPRRFPALPFHDPAGGWITAGGECQVVTAVGAEQRPRSRTERKEI